MQFTGANFTQTAGQYLQWKMYEINKKRNIEVYI